MHQAGLVSVSFRALSFEQVIAAAADAELSYIEWGSDVHAPCTDSSRLRAIAAAQDAAGIRCSSYGTYFRLGSNPVTELTAYFDAARQLGTDTLRLWCGTRGSAAYSPAQLQQLYDDCRAAAAIAENAGITLCMECHNGTLTDTASAALALMRAVDSPAFRMYYQPNQLRTVQENIDYARCLAPYTRHVHVFHWRGQDKFPLREGLSDWNRYLAALGGQRMLLLEFMPDDRVQSLKTEAAALRELIGGCV